jgi:uncharacterized protein YggT (Ycf19 family)
MVVLDTVTQVERFLGVFVGVYVLVIFLYVLTSWIQLPYSLRGVQRFLYDVCEPYLRLFRRVIPPLGPLDLSPIAAVFALYLLGMLVNALIGRVL